jgi:hypothetical protein
MVSTTYACPGFVRSRLKSSCADLIRASKSLPLDVGRSGWPGQARPRRHLHGSTRDQNPLCVQANFPRTPPGGGFGVGRGGTGAALRAIAKSEATWLFRGNKPGFRAPSDSRCLPPERVRLDASVDDRVRRKAQFGLHLLSKSGGRPGTRPPRPAVGKTNRPISALGRRGRLWISLLGRRACCRCCGS